MKSLTSLQDCLDKRCVIGLTYFDLQGQIIKQTLLAGQVTQVDQEKGITLQLLSEGQGNQADFILPIDLSCWFSAPKGEYHISSQQRKMLNPDYLVTWDIYQTQNNKANGQHQWWEWVPRSQQPIVNQKDTN